MRSEYKKLLDMLPMANSEEIKMLAEVLYRIIDYSEETITTLKQRVADLEADEEPILKGKEEIIKTKEDIIKVQDERIAFPKEWLKDKNKEIERLRLQLQTNELERFFVFGKVGIGEA